MSSKASNLSKVIQSVTMRQLNSLKNQIFRLKNQEVQYTKFHSQFGEDRYIYENIDLLEKGVFVDVGAGHPSYLSNTYFFEKNGWTGICIDAEPTQYELLKKERANVEWAAISDREGEIEFSQSYFPSYSSAVGKEEYKGLLKVPFKQTIKVPSYRLETILEKFQIGQIDLLDIDVEGSEIEVWQTFNYEKHQPKVVIMEYQTFGLADNSEKIKEFFSNLPYKLVHVTCTNFIFLNLLA
ncbi:FkbM family methyltransferase [Nostoc sp. ChiQUE01b]|uniref:FkbM family methyltransferase n=1 Tax=Nostoc sp. ChiQUE01b TaxID=3075376 RepID=UPI002AD557A9|nr:FkbM family methyltransferase [Nostoc sp. ChiQUE01b]MDZ8261513.1 FkbM family methyltransferase [Nostoc sp. ChiQUE01b]